MSKREGGPPPPPAPRGKWSTRKQHTQDQYDRERLSAIEERMRQKQQSSVNTFEGYYAPPPQGTQTNYEPGGTNMFIYPQAPVAPPLPPKLKSEMKRDSQNNYTVKPASPTRKEVPAHNSPVPPWAGDYTFKRGKQSPINKQSEKDHNRSKSPSEGKTSHNPFRKQTTSWAKMPKPPGPYEGEPIMDRKPPELNPGEPAYSNMATVSSTMSYASSYNDSIYDRPNKVENDSGSESEISSASDVAQGGYECELCQTSEGILFCNQCQMPFCKECWSQYPSHKPRKNPIRGVALVKHEAIDPVVEAKLDKILEPRVVEKKQDNLHDQDEDTAWFAVVKDKADDLIFQDLGRYGALVAGLKKKCYPGLVSFIGPTGAGKSALIRMLIELHYSGTQQYDSPVVKSTLCHQTLPTSGDVHLFCDPHTCKPDVDRPILYADCEGLGGGERTPLGSRTLKRERLHKKIAGHRSGSQASSFQKRNRRTHQNGERELKWATTDDTRRREFIVSELYPRLLYTFSDVVVFVMKEANSIETVIERLLIWAAAAIEKSSNQPVLPHALIAMNSIPNDVAGDFWDVKLATRSIMHEANIEFRQNPKFLPFIKYWEDRGSHVRSIWDLLTLYYHTVKVVRIPRKGRSNLISEQVSKLYTEIKESARESQRVKRERRMLMNSATLQNHLQSAYDHFARSLETPFDFVKAAFANNPIPSDFGGNILKLILNVKKSSIYHTDAKVLLRKVAPIIAYVYCLTQLVREYKDPQKNSSPNINRPASMRSRTFKTKTGSANLFIQRTRIFAASTLRLGTTP